MKQPSDSDPFMDLQFDLLDEDSVPDESKAAAVPPPRRAREASDKSAIPEISAEPISIEIDDADIFARDTAIPSLPPDEFAAVSMRSIDGSTPEANAATIDTLPPPGGSVAPPSADLEFADFGHPADVFGQALPGAFPSLPPPPTDILGTDATESPTAPPRATAPGRQPEGPLGDTTRNPVFVEESLQKMADIPDSGQESSPLGFVDAHARFVDSLSPVAGLQGQNPTPIPDGGGGNSSRAMQEAYDLGDYTQALEVAEGILEADPGNSEAKKIAQESRTVLTQMLAARVGPLDQVMSVVISPEEMQWLSLDHRSGFLLSLVDGQSTVDEILDISGMSRHDALKIILNLTRQQVVQLA